MGLIEDLLGCSLMDIKRSYWAVKLKNGEWICEARVKTDIYKGQVRQFDWSNDVVANGDVMNVTQIWLLCPPSKTSPTGNTAYINIAEPGTAFQFKLTLVDTNIASIMRRIPYHIIGRVDNKETGDCTCFIWDPVQDGMLTPESKIYDPSTATVMKNEDGSLKYVGKNNVYNFHSWDVDRVAHLGRLELNTLGVRI